MISRFSTNKISIMLLYYFIQIFQGSHSLLGTKGFKCFNPMKEYKSATDIVASEVNVSYTQKNN